MNTTVGTDFLDDFSELLREAEAVEGVDLSDEGIIDFVSRQQPVVRKTLDQIESAEGWVADNEWNAVDSLIRLGRALTPDDLRDLGSSPSADLIKLLGYVKMSRALVMVNRLLDEGGEEAESMFLTRCKETASAEPESAQAFRMVLNRLLYLKRTRLIQRIYSPRRALRIIEALKSVTLQ